MPDAARVLLLRVHGFFHGNTARLGNLGECLARLLKHWNLLCERHQAAESNVAVRWRNLATVTHAPEHVRGGDRSPAAEE